MMRGIQWPLQVLSTWCDGLRSLPQSLWARFAGPRKKKLPGFVAQPTARPGCRRLDAPALQSLTWDCLAERCRDWTDSNGFPAYWHNDNDAVFQAGTATVPLADLSIGPQLIYANSITIQGGSRSS